MTTYLHMADAAFASNIPPGFDIAGGYYGGPSAYHVWTRQDWQRFPGCKVPIWVAGLNGAEEGHAAVRALHELRVPPNLQGMGTITVLDMETRHDRTYVDAFQAVLNAAGYLVWDYGSLDEVYQDPEANGYWVADYTTVPNAEAVLAQQGTRAVQYAADLAPGYDASLVKPWTAGLMWGGQ